jgi:mitogen-activated protein kinase 1/3
LIFNLVGTPTKDEINQIENERWREYTRKAKKCRGKDFDKLFAGSNPLAIDLLKKLLVFDPKKRISVEGALKHPYLKGLHIEEDEPTRGPINPIEFEFEKYKLNGE